MNKAELKRRKAEMSVRAKAEIAKSGIVQFRLEPPNILKLYEASVRAKKPVGTMVREWVLERLQTDKSNQADNRLEELLELPARVQALEKRVGGLLAKVKNKT